MNFLLFTFTLNCFLNVQAPKPGITLCNVDCVMCNVFGFYITLYTFNITHSDYPLIVAASEKIGMYIERTKMRTKPPTKMIMTGSISVLIVVRDASTLAS